MKAKYLVCPGFVTSKYDKDTHWISADDLIRLYGVRADECLVLRPWRQPTHPEGLIELRPKYNGDYELPQKR